LQNKVMEAQPKEATNAGTQEQKQAAGPIPVEQGKPVVVEAKVEAETGTSQRQGGSAGKEVAEQASEGMAKGPVGVDTSGGKQPQKSTSLEDIAREQKTGGYVSAGPIRGTLTEARSAIAGSATRLFGMGHNVGGRGKELNRAINRSKHLKGALDESSRGYRKRLAVTREWIRLKKKYGQEVEKDYADALLAGDMSAFVNKYGGDIEGAAYAPRKVRRPWQALGIKPERMTLDRSPILQIAEELIALDRVRDPLIGSRHLTPAQSEALRENGNDYRKTAYLRYILGERFADWIKKEDPGAVQRAKDHLEAGLRESVDRLNKRVASGKATPTELRHMDAIIDVINQGSSLNVIVNESALKSVVDAQIEYYLTRKGKAASGGGEGALPVQHLMHKHLEGVFKELYKPITDPVETALLSIDAVHHLAIQNRFLDALFETANARVVDGKVVGHLSMPTSKDGPGVIDPSWTKTLSGTQWGALDGAHISPELARALLPTDRGVLRRAYFRLLGTHRLSKLLNPPTMGRNAVTSFQFMLSSGDLIRKETLPGILRYRKLVDGVKKGEPWALREWRTITENGVINTHGSSLVQDFTLDIASAGYRAKGLEAMLERGTEGASRFYSSIDFTAKASAYYITLDRLKKAGITGDRAEEMAVEHVRRFYQSPESLPEFTRLISKSGFTDFFGYQVDSVRMRVNALEHAIKSSRGIDTPDGKIDLAPLAGFLSASFLSALAFSEGRKAFSKLSGWLHENSRELIGGDEATSVTPATDAEVDAIRSMMPLYHKSNAYMAWYDEKGVPYVFVADAVYGYPVELMLVGAAQQMAERGPGAGLSAVGDYAASTIGPNMFNNLLLRELFGIDLNAATTHASKDRAQDFFNQDAFPTDRKLAIPRAAIGIVSDFVPGNVANKAAQVYDFVQEKKLGILQKDAATGLPLRRTPAETALSLISLVRPLRIEMKQALRWSGGRKQQAIADTKRDIGRLRHSLNDPTRQTPGLVPKEQRRMDALLQHLEKLYLEADKIVADFDVVNKSLDQKERDETIKDVFGAAFAEGGGKKAFEEYKNKPAPGSTTKRTRTWQ